MCQLWLLNPLYVAASTSCKSSNISKTEEFWFQIQPRRKAYDSKLFYFMNKEQ